MNFPLNLIEIPACQHDVLVDYAEIPSRGVASEEALQQLQGSGLYCHTAKVPGPGFLGAVAVVETFADFAVSVAVQCVVGALETVAFRHCSSMRPLLQFQWQLARCCGVTIAAVAAVGYYGQHFVKTAAKA